MKEKNRKHYLAVDIGASSGRAILGEINNLKVQTQEVHRFKNEMLFENGHYHWDIDKLFEEILTAIKKSVNEYHITPASIAVDTWGVDFGLLNNEGKIISKPFAYREPMNEKGMNHFFSLIPKQEIYNKTGIQFMQFNSVFQLAALKLFFPELLQEAKELLFMPDLINYLLTGNKFNEFTIASTSQLLNPEKGNWEYSFLDALDINHSLMQKLIFPGDIIGNISPSICKQYNIPSIPVVAAASHDTGSAVASIPATGNHWAYISSGTWSLMGVESEKPIINQASYNYAFTNEGGVNNTYRVLKNITGLWLLQECRKEWMAEKEYAFSELMKMGENAEAFQSFVDPDHPDFMNPENMVDAIQTFCKASHQKIPEQKNEIIRCIYESLALKYKYTLDQLKKISSPPIDTIHIIGGGAQNSLLCQFAANATGLRVIAGPSEGTAYGNLMVQAMASGEVHSLKDIRARIKNSVDLNEYQPEKTKSWELAYDKFCSLIDNEGF